MKIHFKSGYLPNASFSAWTKYEVDEEIDYYNLEVVFNKHFHNLPKEKQFSIIIHELVHCSFYQMHAEELLNDGEVIALNEMIDNNFPTLFFVDSDKVEELII